MPVITLTTDFGLLDAYVGSVKGAILSINPKAQIIDVTHGIPSYDIVRGAFYLGGSFSVFPRGTIHVAVVDPGVGSERSPLLVVTRNYFFVAPDNGLLTLALEKDPPIAIFELTVEKYFRDEVSTTFHARDVFGPVAAHLSKGIKPRQMGKKRSDLKLLPVFKKVPMGGGWKGEVLFFDKFGNAVTNMGLKKGELEKYQVYLEGKAVSAYQTYASIPKNTFGVLRGSSGFLEIAHYEDSFQQRHGASRGMEIILKKR